MAKKEHITNYIKEIFSDTIASMVYRKEGSRLSDKERNQKVEELVEKIRVSNVMLYEQTQEIIDRCEFDSYKPAVVNGKSCYKLLKMGRFKKVLMCYFISKTKGEVTAEYLEQVLDELKRQSEGENVFGSPDYKDA
ncbi:hypothetical protein [Ruminococcus sp.]|uniref:hypothetical protein n=1 Tax=Ruminococcus sp. TaxID=41978 RepID=UPI0026004883|nr:hypothetical protein [Ruminococcus sp.]MBQ8965552.1 hypothetical protein [Ruminococcus sp.]